jgi:hypothetical protein
MLRLSCSYVRADLSACHDEELSVQTRIAIAEHLADCPSCAVEAEDLRAMRDALRATGSAMHASWLPSLVGLQSEIVGRLEVESTESLTSRARRLIEDPGHVWATAAAAVAGSVCVLVMAVFGGGLIAHPASFAALLNARTQDVEILPASPLIMPRADVEAIMPAAMMNQDDEEESVSAFAALITPDGHITDLELLAQDSWKLAVGHHATDPRPDLLAAVATARFEPARVDGAPVALNVVWLITHQTVRGSMPSPRIPAKSHVRKTV